MNEFPWETVVFDTYLESYSGDFDADKSCDFERLAPVDQVKAAVTQLLYDLLGNNVVLQNPLVALRQLERDAPGDSVLATRSRRDMLLDLDGLSMRLWKMSPSTSFQTILDNLLTQDDYGLDDLVLLDTYACLFDRRVLRLESEAGQDTEASQQDPNDGVPF